MRKMGRVTGEDREGENEHDSIDCLCGPDDCKILCAPIYALEQPDRKL